MTAKQLTFWNRIVATEVFIIALLTFGLTVEPTASFWDAGEYIATSAKLQVGHPPEHLFPNDGGFFCPVCHWTRKDCLDGEFDVCIFKCLHHLISLFNPYAFIA